MDIELACHSYSHSLIPSPLCRISPLYSVSHDASRYLPPPAEFGRIAAIMSQERILNIPRKRGKVSSDTALDVVRLLNIGTKKIDYVPMLWSAGLVTEIQKDRNLTQKRTSKMQPCGIC
jgi:hypothetical protein